MYFDIQNSLQLFELDDNVSEPSLSHQAYHTSAFNVFIPFEIENQVDLLRFNWNKLNLHCDNVSKLSDCLGTLTFQIEYICAK